MRIKAIVFDMDGVLIDSEQVWDAIREQLTRDTGGTWRPDAQTTMMGMNSFEWSEFMARDLKVPMEPEEISNTVVQRLIEAYSQKVPLLPFAREAVTDLAERYSLAIASSSNKPVIEAVLELTGLAKCFSAVVSSEEVSRGKPAPDVYLEAARRLGVEPHQCAAIEDSSNGLRSAAAAGMTVIAVPNAHYPPAGDALQGAHFTVSSLRALSGVLNEFEH